MREVNNIEKLYQSGITYLSQRQKIKASIAFISAALDGHEAAQAALENQINFKEEYVEGLRFTFDDSLPSHERYKILQSLYADQLISKDTYLGSLLRLRKQIEKGNEANNNPETLRKIEKQEMLHSDYPDSMRQYAQAKLYLQAKTAKKSPDIWNDYYQMVLPVVKACALIIGDALGFTVGILEHAFIFPILFKVDAPGLKASHIPGDNAEETSPRGRDFLEWIGFERKSIHPARIYIADTGFGSFASWVGRSIGLLLSAAVVAMVSVVAYPIYHYYRSRYEVIPAAAKTENSMNVQENTPLLGSQEKGQNKSLNTMGATIEEAAALSLKDKGQNSKKNYPGIRLFSEQKIREAQAQVQAPNFGNFNR